MDFPSFAVACGEEGSDPLVLHEGRTVRVDQYADSSHLEHLDRDLADVAGLGVEVWRYGMPWRLAEPAPGSTTGPCGTVRSRRAAATASIR